MKTKKLKTKKRLLSILMCVMMMLTLCPQAAFAEDAEAPELVSCTVTEGCTLEEGHEGDCVTDEEEAADPEKEQQLPRADQCASRTSGDRPADEAVLKTLSGQVSDIYSFAEANGLALSEKQIGVLEAVSAAMYPADTIDDTKFVARITNADGTVKEECATLAEALKAVTSGCTVTLLGNVDLGSSYAKFYDASHTVSNVTLDLGGFTLKGKNDRVVQVAGTGFTIQNGTIENYGTSNTGSCITASRGSLTVGAGLTTKGKIGVYADPSTENCIITINGATVNGTTYGAYVEGPGTPSAHKGTANLIVTSGSVTGGTAGISVLGAQNPDAGISSVTVNGGAVSGGCYGIAGNGNSIYGKTSITISGGTVTATNTDDSTGIFHPQDGTLSVTGGAISGVTGIEMRAGTLEVSGGTITGGAGEPTFTANGNGSTAKNVGIAVAQHTTQKAISVTVKGADTKVSGGSALAEADPQGNQPTNVTLTVEGGSFTATSDQGKAVSVESCKTPFISGGVFSTDVDSDYVVTDKTTITDPNTGNQIVVDKDSVAVVDGVGYKTVQDAVDAAIGTGKKGKVSVIKNANENVVIPEDADITLDVAKDVTLTDKGGHTITNHGTLTITGSGTVDNVTHGKGALYNDVGATAVLKGCTFKRSKENGQSSADNGSNSWYTIKNFGTMEIYDGVNVIQNGHYSSLLGNGWQNYNKAVTGSGEPKPNTEAKLTIYGGNFNGGLNTIKNDDFAILKIKGGTFTNITQHAVMNWNVAEISGGTFDTSQGNRSTIFCAYDNDTFDKGTLTITGGTFKAAKDVSCFQADGAVKIAVSGGTFTSAVPEDYCAENFNPQKNKNGTYGVHKHKAAAERVGVKEATCTEAGYTGDVVCTICGETMKMGTEIAMAAHTSDGGKVTTPATETTTGVMTYSCTVCGTVLKTETIPVLTPSHTQGGKTERIDSLKTGGKTDRIDSPKTGDNSNLTLWIVLLVLAGAGLAGTTVYSRKGKHSR